MGKMRLPFIDSDLLYRGVHEDSFDCINVQNLLQSNLLWWPPLLSNNLYYVTLNFKFPLECISY